MFLRTKPRGNRIYVQLVESVRKGSSVRQRVLASLGRLDLLQASGTLERLLASGGRLSKQVAVLSACQDSLQANPDGAESRVLGPALVFEPLWTLSGCRQAVHHALAGRRFRFAAERAVFLTVLHRLFAPGSDRSALQWAATQPIRSLRYCVPLLQEVQLEPVPDSYWQHLEFNLERCEDYWSLKQDTLPDRAYPFLEQANTASPDVSSPQPTTKGTLNR